MGRGAARKIECVRARSRPRMRSINYRQRRTRTFERTTANAYLVRRWLVAAAAVASRAAIVIADMCTYARIARTHASHRTAPGMLSEIFVRSPRRPAQFMYNLVI